MGVYHINDEGNAGLCRAKKKPCPFGGWNDHYGSKEDAQKGYEEKQELLALVEKGRNSEYRENAATEQAVLSPLSYSGPLPKWFNNLTDETNALYGEGDVPEIIDTMKIDDKDYAVVWTRRSTMINDVHMQKNRGYRMSTVELRNMEDGTVVGYVKSAYVDEKSPSYAFGNDGFEDLRSYQDRSGGAHFLKRKEEAEVDERGRRVKLTEFEEYPAPYDENTDAETRVAAKRELWSQLHKGLEYVPEDFDRRQLTWGSLVNLKAEHAPADEKTLDEHIAVARKKIAVENENWAKGHEIPVIDFSRLEDGFRGRGLAPSMYVYTARMLGKEGRQLSSSGIQSDEAQVLWKRMASDSRIKVDVISRRYEKEGYVKTDPFLALDFRNEEGSGTSEDNNG